MFSPSEIDTIQTSLDYMATLLEGGMEFDGNTLDWEEVESLRDSNDLYDYLEDPYEIDTMLVALDLLIDLMRHEMDLDTNVLTIPDVQALKAKVSALKSS